MTLPEDRGSAPGLVVVLRNTVPPSGCYVMLSPQEVVPQPEFSRCPIWKRFAPGFDSESVRS